MILAVSSYSFSQSVDQGRMAFLDIPARARDMGFGAIELAGLPVPAGRSPASVAREVRAACDHAGLPVVNYAVGADFLRGSGGDWRAEANRLLGELEIAAILGSPRMRHDASQGFPDGSAGSGDFDAALPILAAGCRRVAEAGAALGIRTLVENHGFFCQDSDRVERLAHRVDHPNFGLLVDIGNFLCADESPEAAVGRVASLAAHVHAKDFHVKPAEGPDPGRGWFRSRGGQYLRGAIVGHGEVPIARCLALLRKAGYDGVLSLEFEGLETPETAIPMGKENLERYWGLAAAM